MSWQNIIKASYSSKNLKMLKESVEELYATIPVGTVFKSNDMYEKFVEIVAPKIGTGQQERRMWTVWSKGKGQDWFPNYFTNYGMRNNYIEREGSRDKAKLKRV